MPRTVQRGPAVMIRAFRSLSAYSAYSAALVLLSAALSGCSGGSTRAAAAMPAEPAPVAVRTAHVQEQAIDRFLRVTGSVTADEQAGVAAETAGRVVGTPVERGTHVAQGSVLVRL